MSACVFSASVHFVTINTNSCKARFVCTWARLVVCVLLVNDATQMQAYTVSSSQSCWRVRWNPWLVRMRFGHVCQPVLPCQHLQRFVLTVRFEKTSSVELYLSTLFQCCKTRLFMDIVYCNKIFKIYSFVFGLLPSVEKHIDADNYLLLWEVIRCSSQKLLSSSGSFLLMFPDKVFILWVKSLLGIFKYLLPNWPSI